MAIATTTTSLSSAHFTSGTAVVPKSSLQRVSFQHVRISATSAAATTAERTKTIPRIAVPTTATTSFYEVLGVQRGATCREIKAAYRRLARVLHPDVTSGAHENNANKTTAYEFMKVNEAYETLSDQEKRADYDRTLFGRRSRPVMAAAARSSASAFYRRTWETDQCW